MKQFFASAALISLAMMSSARAQEGPTYQQCLTWANRCAIQFSSLGFNSGAACWDATYRDVCTGTTSTYDPVTRSYVLYYGPIRMVYYMGHLPPMPD